MLSFDDDGTDAQLGSRVGSGPARLLCQTVVFRNSDRTGSARQTRTWRTMVSQVHDFCRFRTTGNRTSPGVSVRSFRFYAGQEAGVLLRNEALPGHATLVASRWSGPRVSRTSPPPDPSLARQTPPTKSHARTS